MSLKAVFFDFGGTIDIYPVILENALKASANMLSILKRNAIDLTDKYSAEEFYQLLNERLGKYKIWKKQTLVELSAEQVWKDYILYDDPKIAHLNTESAEELTLLIETGRFTRTVRPEMKRTMEELTRTGLYFGIISNVLSRTQVPVNLVDYGLESYFSSVTLSSVFGRVKPHKSIFLHAAEKSGFCPEECLYVGNSPSKDITGAKNAGFLGAVQIEYFDDSDDTTDLGMEPDFYIRSMDELPDIIRLYQKMGA